MNFAERSRRRGQIIRLEHTVAIARLRDGKPVEQNRLELLRQPCFPVEALRSVDSISDERPSGRVAFPALLPARRHAGPRPVSRLIAAR
jgi:hypothetical protein